MFTWQPLISAWVLTLLISVGNAQSKTSIPWTLGMDMNFFLTTSTTIQTCPPNLPNAKTSNSVQPIYSGTTVTVGGSPPSSTTGSSSFRLTNGWMTAGIPFGTAAQTFIQASEPSATGGGCWLSNPSGAIIISPCGSDRGFQFYLEIGSAGPYTLNNADLIDLYRQPSTGGLYINKDGNQPNVCIYDAASGLPVVAPATAYHFTANQISNLTGVLIPTTLTGEEFLPGCENGLTQDCLIAKTVNGMSANCKANPSLRECMLTLGPAFCFDIPAVRLGLTDSIDAQAESCFRNVPLGPCVANPSGAACMSGKYAGIVQFGSQAGKAPGRRRRSIEQPFHSSVTRRQNKGPLFGDNQSYLPAEDEFWVGVMKNLINSAISVYNLFRDGIFFSSQASCYGTAIWNTDAATAARLRQGCAEMFTPHTPVAELSLDSDIEKAGSIFADVVSLLWVGADLAKAANAAKWVGKVESVLARFKPKSVGTSGGSILEATEGSNTVQIFNDNGNGKGVPIFTDKGVREMEEATIQESFGNCKQCVGAIVKRQGGILRKLCCFALPKEVVVGPTPNGITDGTVITEAILPAQRVIGATTALVKDAPGLNALGEGSAQFKAYYIGNAPPRPVLDPVTSAFYDAVSKYYTEINVRPSNIGGWREEIEYAARQTFAVTDDDVNAVLTWVSREQTSLGLAPALGKIPPIHSWVIATTPLSDAALTSLKSGGKGWVINGDPGVYTLKDLFAPVFTTGHTDGPGILSTSLGMFPVFQTATTPYRFVIRSSSGRYIPPFWGTYYHEVVFMEPYAGKFKLLGFEELNGGELARQANKPPPYGVFYFEEIDVPVQPSYSNLKPPVITFPASQ